MASPPPEMPVVPAALPKFVGNITTGNSVDTNGLVYITPADVQRWMQGFCSRYSNTRLIDVVNEPPPHQEPRYSNAIGGGTNGNWQWIVNAFTWARQACPNATLILNDYNNIEIANQNQHFIDIVKALQAQGAPIDGLGAQSHGLNGAKDFRSTSRSSWIPSGFAGSRSGDGSSAAPGLPAAA